MLTPIAPGKLPGFGIELSCPLLPVVLPVLLTSLVSAVARTVLLFTRGAMVIAILVIQIYLVLISLIHCHQTAGDRGYPMSTGRTPFTCSSRLLKSAKHLRLTHRARRVGGSAGGGSRARPMPWAVMRYEVVKTP